MFSFLGTGSPLLAGATAAAGVVAALLPAAVYASVAGAYLRWGEAVWRRLRWVPAGPAALLTGLVGAVVVGAAAALDSDVAVHAAVLVAVGVSVAAVPVVATTANLGNVRDAVGLSLAVPVGVAAAFVVTAVGVSAPARAALWTVAAAAPAVAALTPLPMAVATSAGDRETALRVAAVGAVALVAGVASLAGLVATGAVLVTLSWALRALTFAAVGVAMATLLVGWGPYLVGRALGVGEEAGESEGPEPEPEAGEATTGTVRRS